MASIYRRRFCRMTWPLRSLRMRSSLTGCPESWWRARMAASRRSWLPGSRCLFLTSNPSLRGEEVTWPAHWPLISCDEVLRNLFYFLQGLTRVLRAFWTGETPQCLSLSRPRSEDGISSLKRCNNRWLEHFLSLFIFHISGWPGWPGAWPHLHLLPHNRGPELWGCPGKLRVIDPSEASILTFDQLQVSCGIAKGKKEAKRRCCEAMVLKVSPIKTARSSNVKSCVMSWSEKHWRTWLRFYYWTMNGIVS